MFTIQYTGADGSDHMQIVDTKSRTRLYLYLMNFPHAIQAIYEQTTPITKTVQQALAGYGLLTMTPECRKFAGLQ